MRISKRRFLSLVFTYVVFVETALSQSLFVPNVLPGGLQNSLVGIGKANDKVASIIQVAKTGTVSAVQWATGVVTTGCTLDVRLERVDPVTGNPSGTLLAPGSNGPQPIVVASRNVSIVTPLGTPVFVSQGDLVAVVVANPPASFCSMQIKYVNVVGVSHVAVPYGASFLNGTWTKSTVLGPQVGLQYQDGSYAASPFTYPISYFTTTTYGSASTPNVIGLRFKLPAAATLTGVWFFGQVNQNTLLKVYGPDGSTVLSSLQLDPNEAGLTVSYQRAVQLQFPVPLLPNTYYRIALVPTTTNPPNILHYLQTYSAAQLDGLSGGQNFHYTSATNPATESDWTQITNRRPAVGLIVDIH
jgi:hypothetical protein